MRPRWLALCLVAAWWWVFYEGAYGWQRYGPFIQEDTCQQTAENFRAAGLNARCVRVEF